MTGTSNYRGARRAPGVAPVMFRSRTGEVPLLSIASLSSNHYRIDVKYLGPPQSGSVANQTASRNRFGQYFRARVTPFDPGSSAQITSRAAMSAANAAWHSLTDEQRMGWNELAAYERTHPGLPQSGPLTGFLAYVRAFMVGSFYTGVTPTDPPNGYGPIFTLTSAEVTLGVGSVSLNWTAGSGERVAYFLTEPVSATWAFSTCRRPRLLGSFAGAPPLDVTPSYVAAFGSLPATGQAVFARFCAVTTVGLSAAIVARAVQP